MKYKTIKILLIISAIIPATILAALNIFGIIRMLTTPELKNLVYIICFVFGILGYLGLWMLFLTNQNTKKKIINILFLICGILSFIIFTSIEGGKNAWNWIITFQELDEWIVYVYPSLISLLFIGLLTMQIIRQMRIQNTIAKDY